VSPKDHPKLDAAQRDQETQNSLLTSAGNVVVGGLAGSARDVLTLEADAAGAIKKAGQYIYSGGKYVVDTVVQTGKDVALDPAGIIGGTVGGTSRDIAHGLSLAGKAGADIINHPVYYATKALQVSKVVNDATIEVGQEFVMGAIDHLRNPSKMIDFVKFATGYDEIMKSWDPNRSLYDRLGNSLIASAKVSTLVYAAYVGTVGAVATKAVTTMGAYGAEKKAEELKSRMETSQAVKTALGLIQGKSANIGTPSQFIH
jgi:hypothetical protein